MNKGGSTLEKIKIGFFGVRRGLTYIRVLNQMEDVEITAILDQNDKTVETAKRELPKDVKRVFSYEELLDSGIDAVILCNYFPEHAKYAAEALRKNISVFSECTPAATLSECVMLAEAAENSKAVYLLAENYPYYRGCRELKRVYETGMLGRVIFAEGEYVHPLSPGEAAKFIPDSSHWRANNPKTYYSTHSITPLIAATGLRPRKVIGKIAAMPGPSGKGLTDGAGIMLVEMEGGALFRISGSCSFGPHGNWYRLGCEKGGIETLRGSDEKVRLVVNDWELTEENHGYASECEYLPEQTEEGRRAAACGHGGSDWYICRHFLDVLHGTEEPFLSVYDACAISAVGILGWRSVLEDSKQLTIPDFSKKEERDLVRNDDLNPFTVDGKEASLPHRYYEPDDDTAV